MAQSHVRLGSNQTSIFKSQNKCPIWKQYFAANNSFRDQNGLYKAVEHGVDAVNFGYINTGRPL